MGDDEWFEALLRLGAVGDREIQQRRAQGLGMAFADLDRIPVDADTRSLISPELARELRALPVKRDGRTLWVAFAQPCSSAESKIADETGMRVIPVLCLPSALEAVLNRL